MANVNVNLDPRDRVIEERSGTATTIIRIGDLRIFIDPYDARVARELEAGFRVAAERGEAYVAAAKAERQKKDGK